MTPETVIDILREALWLIVLLSAVIIGPGLVVGLVVSTFQAATQINEQTLSFLPRLLVTLIVIIVAGPWMLTQLLDHAHRLISSIPYLIG
ncbi:flagellar biosynthesis protein FliQ [Marinobacter lutaoensis]|jgi:flagellar biosynthetic protein FliQ|uniref:Flagellar biosynthetic protein FliQ n=1 Tax=Marinobacter lutaoensis TaxID=135739 RepID=A0A1V2DXX7_9GAMM|nr:flagellar biosynthesis protein FliQ [Marinobacter lutaoensis]MBE03297.1 flagellar biosynthetic protein FliQ [Marinobacter sp.]MBI44521.1 flagellar biosynthetic protein FliQ [Oceanospirillales bacterium]NVD34457.1 flagellar biosynthesis protein FliQ [Marinobacter lutaoensis]ONF45141.1 flagellar biosynthetic protein FliQ [Marinobacter lutaoensis]|tara:strand:+ start:794 stop:1063 length:270 start_codon:yes stop_codon:yes gene_type:complete